MKKNYLNSAIAGGIIGMVSILSKIIIKEIIEQPNDFNENENQIFKGSNCTIALESNKCPKETIELHSIMQEAIESNNNGNYRYALFLSRLVLENSLKMIISKYKIDDRNQDSIFNDLIICEHYGIINPSLIDNLHSSRKICNYNSHEINCEEKTNQANVNYVINQISELLNVLDLSFSC